MKEKKGKVKNIGTSQTTSVDEDTQGYFKRVGDVLEEDNFDDAEARSLFVENVFTQIHQNEVKLCCEQTISVIMEKLIPILTTVQVRAFAINMERFWNVVITDKFGSHVLQTLVNNVVATIKADVDRVKETITEDEELPSMEVIFLKFCDFIQENLQEFIAHTYASHVVRAVFQALAGVRVSKIMRSRPSQEGRPKKIAGKKTRQDTDAFTYSAALTTVSMAVPESFYPVLKKITKTILKQTNLESLVLHPVCSPVLGTLLLVLHPRDKSLCSKVCKAVISKAEIYKDGDDGSRIPQLFTHEIGSHLFEVILQVASPRLYKELFEKIFKNHLLQLSQHHIANYIVQHLLTSTTDPEQAEMMIDELLEYTEDILAVGHMGIIVRLAEICVRLKIKQKAFVTSLLEAFHCKGKEEKKRAVPLVLSLTTFDVYYKASDVNVKASESEREEVEKSEPTKLKSINFHGAILLKILFGFDKPNIFVKSFLKLLPEELLTLALDPMGSYTVEGFIQSPTVVPKKKHEFVEKMKGKFVKLATDKHASHVIDSCWKHLEVKDKEIIRQELAADEQILGRNFFGRIILQKCGIQHYKRKSGKLGDQEKILKKQKMLDEIFGKERDTAVKVKPKKIEKANKLEKRNDKILEREEGTKIGHVHNKELKSLGFNPKVQSVGKIEDDFYLQPPPNYFEDESDQCPDDTIDLLFTKRKEREVEESRPQPKRKKYDGEESKVSNDLDLIISAIEETKPKKSKTRKNKKKAI